MKPIKIKPFASLLAAVLLAGCAGLGGMNTTQEPNSEAQKQLLAERVAGLWKHMENKNWEAAYDYYDPFFRAAVPKKEFAQSRLQAIYYYNSSVGDIQILGRIAQVKVPIEIEIKELMVAPGRVQSGPRKPRVLETRWLWIDNNWYAQFYGPRDSTYANY